MFDFDCSWFDDLRRFQTDESKSKHEIMENLGIRSRFPQMVPLFQIGSRNGVRIGVNGGPVLPVRKRRGLTCKVNTPMFKSVCKREELIEIKFEIRYLN